MLAALLLKYYYLQLDLEKVVGQMLEVQQRHLDIVKLGVLIMQCKSTL
jgi:hypothetical protein